MPPSEPGPPQIWPGGCSGTLGRGGLPHFRAARGSSGPLACSKGHPCSSACSPSRGLLSMALSCQCPVLLQEGLPQGAMLEHHSFIHRIDKYLLSTYQVPHDVLGMRQWQAVPRHLWSRKCVSGWEWGIKRPSRYRASTEPHLYTRTYTRSHNHVPQDPGRTVLHSNH